MGDATLKFDVDGYVTDQSETVNLDGSTTVETVSNNIDGSLAKTFTSTVWTASFPVQADFGTDSVKTTSVHSKIGANLLSQSVATTSADGFGPRDAPYLLGVEANWVDPADDETDRQWTRETCARMSQFSTQTSYLNFEPDPMVISKPQSARLDRLAALKRWYDPDNLFRNNHTMAPA